MRMFPVFAVLYLIFGLNFGNSARILGIFQTPSISHQVVFRGLTLALNKRGHELVVVTTDPVNDPSLKNYTEIDLSSMYNFHPNINFIDLREEIGSWMEMAQPFHEVARRSSETIFQHPEFQKIYSRQSNEKFDLLMVEMLYSHSIYALADRFDVPIIGVASLGLTVQGNHAVGNPLLPSHPSNWEGGKNVDYHLSFWERLRNFVDTWQHLRYFETQIIPQQHEIAVKHLGSDIPYVGDIEKNISLVFINQRAALSHVKPTVPKMIEIGGFHLSKEVQSLPKDLKKFLDDSTEGFIYMSLGTNIKSQMLSKSAREDFMAVFSKLPQRVLWKFEDDVVPGKPENVYISKWLPQQAVLAHHNLKIFVYQGGLQSTEEAVKYAVPMIGLPIFADQDSQVSKMVSLGVAKRLEIVGLKREDFAAALHEVINNRSYKEKMLELRSFVNDRPHDLLENAVWWTEFVIRHKGAPHLRCSTVDEPWYQRFDVDIIAFISITTFIIVSLSLAIACRIIFFGFNLLQAPYTGKKLKLY